MDRIVALLLVAACTPGEEGPPPPVAAEVVDALDPVRMKADVDVLADDATGGRIPGSAGWVDARRHILEEMEAIGLEPLGRDGDYVYTYDNAPREDRFMFDDDGGIVPQSTSTGWNLVGRLPGSDPGAAQEHMVVMAHYDHLGVTEDGAIFNGAFDNAGGVAVALELARVMKERDAVPGRSVVFLFTDDEEFGLTGAKEWIADPTVDKGDIVFGVSVDPVGRRLLPDFGPVALMGTERSPALKAMWEEAASLVDTPTYFIHRDIIPVFQSDHDEFFRAEMPLPALWFTNVGFTWYHTVGDTPETLDYRMLLDDAELLLYALALVGADDRRYDYEGPPDIGADEGREAQRFLKDVLSSRYPDDTDRERVQYYVDQIQPAVDADDVDALENANATFFATLFFLLFDLPQKHPGTVPPPFPE